MLQCTQPTKKKMFSYVTNKKYHTHGIHNRKSLLTNTVTTNKTKNKQDAGRVWLKKGLSKGMLMQFVAL